MLEVLAVSPALTYGFAALLGLVIGSFLNVVILRLPRMLEERFRRECAGLDGKAAEAGPRFDLVTPGSRCPHCGHQIRPLENIPILSYLALRGRCSACASPIGLRYPLVEGATAILSVLVVWRFGLSYEAAAALVLTWGLIALAVIDLDTQYLPDAITIPFLWMGLLLSLGGVLTDSAGAIIGATLGYGSLWLSYRLFLLLTGKEGMGFGDFKLLAMLGAWLGWAYLPQIIVVSAASGSLVGGLAILSGRLDRGSPMPFGPYLAAAGWVALMWGEGINQAYLQWADL